MLNLRLRRQLFRPAAFRIEQIELVELVPVVIGAEEDPPVARHADTAHGLVREDGQLVGPAPLDRHAPEVELSRDIAGEQQLLAVGREGQRRSEAPDSEKLLEERRRSGPRDGHRPDLT